MLETLANASRAVESTRSRNAKRDLLAETFRSLPPAEARLAAHYLTGTLPQGKIGLGPKILRGIAGTPPAEVACLSLATLDRTFAAIAATKGAGSQAKKTERLAELFRAATADEQRFLFHLLIGEMRQGALEGVLVEALAVAYGIDGPSMRRAQMLLGDVAEAAYLAATRGQDGIDAVRLTLGRPVGSMLAQPSTLDDALDGLDEAVVDLKLDGARVQVHKDRSEVAVFSRHGNDVTDRVPEVVEVVRAMSVDTVILDGEALVMQPDGRPAPFQTTMRRFGRRIDVAEVRERLPLAVQFFDLLHAEQTDCIDAPLVERLRTLERLVDSTWRVPSVVAADTAALERFFDDALERGHEGAMVKDPRAPYLAGGRGRAWRKLKHAHTLDLVVLAAEWGSGRRQGTLSNLHLGAWDPAHETFVMLGKTFKGLTDELLAWQTEAFQAIAVDRDAYAVYVEPTYVVEVAFNDVQVSPQYPGGVALRFARVKRYRPDKAPRDADTLERVVALAPGSLRGGI